MKKLLFLLLFALGLLPVLPAQDSLNYTLASEISLKVIPDLPQNQVYISWEMKEAGDVSLSVIDEVGEMALTIPLKKVPQCLYSKAIAVQAFCPGDYMVVLSIAGQVYAEKFKLVVTLN